VTVARYYSFRVESLEPTVESSDASALKKFKRATTHGAAAFLVRIVECAAITV